MNLLSKEKFYIFFEESNLMWNNKSLEFYKKFDNDVVKLVKLKREKRLELKTLFVKD
jgi:hypothetical protein